MSAAEAKAFQFVFVDVAANFAQEIFHTALTLLWLTNEIMLKVWASHQIAEKKFPICANGAKFDDKNNKPK